jgi:hypothetical protein
MSLLYSLRAAIRLVPSERRSVGFSPRASFLFRSAWVKTHATIGFVLVIALSARNALPLPVV